MFVDSGVQHIMHCGLCFDCLRLVLCVRNVANFSGLSILNCPFGILTQSTRRRQSKQRPQCIMCWTPLSTNIHHVFKNYLLRCAWFAIYYTLAHSNAMLPISLDCPFLIAPSVFSNVYSGFLRVLRFPPPIKLTTMI
jgi:hypothetical protein